MLDEALRKIRTQIKFGRVVEAEKALAGLLSGASTGDRARILPVFIVFSIKTGGYDQAAGAIRECLSLDISPELRNDLTEKLVLCEQKIAVVPYEPDIQSPELVAFLEGIPKLLSSKPSGGHKLVELTSPADEVKRCAHDQNIGAPYFSWNAVRTSASKEMMDYVYARKIFLDSFKGVCLLQILRICRDVIREGTAGYLYFDDIYADLSLIARGLFIGKLSHPLGEMREAYEMSLFPCGWKGAFPDGELVVHRLW